METKLEKQANLIKELIKKFLEESDKIDRFVKTITPDRIDELVKDKRPINKVEEDYLSKLLSMEILKQKIGAKIRLSNSKFLLEEYTKNQQVNETKLDSTYGMFLSINVDKYKKELATGNMQN